MFSFQSNFPQVVNHPIYPGETIVTHSSDELSYDGKELSRGMRGIIEWAMWRGFLPEKGASTQEPPQELQCVVKLEPLHDIEVTEGNCPLLLARTNGSLDMLSQAQRE